MKKINIIFALVLIFFFLCVLVLVFFFSTSSKKVGDSRTKAAGEIVAFLSPATQNVAVGSGTRVPVELKIKNITGQRVDNMKVVAVNLSFNPSKADLFSLVDADIVCDPSLPTKMPSSITDTALYFTCANMGTSFGLNSQEEMTVATLTFTELANVADGTNFAIDFDSSVSPNVTIPDQLLNNLGAPGLGASIIVGAIVSPTATPTPTEPPPTLTPTPTEVLPSATPTQIPNTFEAAINFKLKGVDSSNNQLINDYRDNTLIPITYRIYNKNDSSINISGTGNAHFTVSGLATYTLIVSNVPDVLKTDAIIWLKAGKHLAARICFVGQTQRCTVNSTSMLGISFTDPGIPGAAWNVDLSSYPLLPGDVNQDGVLNGQDLVEMMIQQNTFPSERNLQYDLDFDGIVIGADYGLMLNSMVVYDDE